MLYQAFSPRERDIALLKSAGWLATDGRRNDSRLSLRRASVRQIEPLLAEWERWTAELLESQAQVSSARVLPVAARHQTRPAGLAMILDTTSILLIEFPRQVNRHHMQVAFLQWRRHAGWIQR